MQNVKKSSFREFIWYGLPTLLSRSSAFLLLPIYTRVLEPKDFGLVSVALVISGVLRLALMLNVENIYLRYGFDSYAQSGHTKNLGNVVRIHCLLLFGLLPLCLYPTLLISKRFATEIPQSFILLAVLTVVMSSLNGPLIGYCRGKQEIKKLGFIQMGGFAIEVLATLVGLFYFKWGALSLLVGPIVGSSFALPFSLPFFIAGFRARPSREIFWQLVRSFATLGPESIAIWSFNAVDRFLLNSFHGPTETGLYSVAFQVSSGLVAIAIISNKQWQVSAYKAHDRKLNSDLMRNLYSRSLALFLVGAAFLSLFGYEIFRWILGSKYLASVPLLPLLMLGAVLRLPEYFVANQLWASHERRKIIYLNTVACIVLIAAQFFFIRSYGARGAALGNIVGLLTYVVFSYFCKNSEFRIPSFEIVKENWLVALVFFFVMSCSIPLFAKALIGVLLIGKGFSLIKKYFVSLEAFNTKAIAESPRL